MEPTNDQLFLSISKTLQERVAPKISDSETTRLLDLVVSAVAELRRRELPIHGDQEKILGNLSTLR